MIEKDLNITRESVSFLDPCLRRDDKEDSGGNEEESRDGTEGISGNKEGGDNKEKEGSLSQEMKNEKTQGIVLLRRQGEIYLHQRLLEQRQQGIIHGKPIDPLPDPQDFPGILTPLTPASS